MLYSSHPWLHVLFRCLCEAHRFCQVSDLKWSLELTSRPTVINLLGGLSGALGCALGVPALLGLG